MTPPPPILHAPTLPPGTPVWASLRMSGGRRAKRGLVVQRTDLGIGAHHLGLVVVGVGGGVECGKLSEGRDVYRKHVVEPAVAHGCGILATTPTRLLRSESWDEDERKYDAPTPDEWAEFLALSKGVPFVATLADPTLPLEVLHQLAIEQGKAIAGWWGGDDDEEEEEEEEPVNKGGRPRAVSDKRARDIRNMYRVWVRVGVREMARKLGLPRSTVADILRGVKKGSRPET